MNIITISLYLLAGLFIYALIFHLILGIQKPIDKKSLVISLCTFSAFFVCIANIHTFQATTIEQVIIPLKVAIGSSFIIYSGIFWFITFYTQKISIRLPILFSLFFTLMFVVNLTQPYSLQFETIHGFQEANLPNNKKISHINGESSNWFILSGFIIFLSLIFQQFVLVRHYFSTKKLTDLYLALSFCILILGTGQALLVRLGILDAIPLGLYALALLLLTWSLIISIENRHQLKLSNFIYEFSGESIILTDKDNKIVSVNPAFTEVTGYTLKEVVGKNPNILNAKKQTREFYDAMWKSLASTDCWQGEILNRRKNGEIYPEWLKIKVIRDANKKIINYIASFSDITQNKKAEEAINSLAFYDALTGLPNRRLMLNRLRDSLHLSARKQQRGAVLFIDLDNLKYLNEVRGHDAGDLLLIEMSNRIQQCLAYGDTLARIGGDIYGVIINGLSIDKDVASLQAESTAIRIQNIISQPFDLQGELY